MSWFAVDDRLHAHRKVIRLRREPHYATAVALWTLAGSWACADSDAKVSGIVPRYVLETFGLAEHEEAAAALCRVGLWEEHADGLAFHDWGIWNGPDAKYKRIEARRAADRERQATHRERKRGKPSRRRPAETLSRDSHVTRGTGRDGTGRDGVNPATREVPTDARTHLPGDDSGPAGCDVCGEPLDDVLTSWGMGAHPGCAGP